MNNNFINSLLKKGVVTQEIIDRFDESLIKMIYGNPQACQQDVIPEGIGEFGLTISNPVPVCSIYASTNYLSCLRTAAGETIRWKRLGSKTGHSQIKMPVDEYQLTDQKGNIIAHIFISPYHWRTSKLAPKGFLLEGNPDDLWNEKL